MREMPLTEHLTELRTRIIKIVFILLISFGVCYSIGEYLQEFLLIPLRSALGVEGKIVFLGLLDKVLAQFQLSFWCSIILSSPFWFSQLWFFIKPGLYPNEVKVIRPFIVFGFLLFCVGVAFGYYIVFPFTFSTILGFGVGNIEAMMSLRDYIVLSSKVLVFLGILFQLPNVLLIMGFMGIINSKKLSKARPYVLTGFAVLAALLTPPDPVTMLALWIPLTVLYEIGLLAVLLLVDPFQKKKDLEVAE